MLTTLIEAYCVHLDSENCSPKTLSYHRHSLSKFRKFLIESEISENPNDWQPVTIRTYFRWLKSTPKSDGSRLSPTSINTYAGSLRSFCHWLVREELCDTNPMEGVKLPRAPKLVKSAFSPEECRKLIAAAKRTRNACRDEALILLLLDTGARANEICQLTVENVDWSQRLARILGKGAVERMIPFSAATAKALQRYLVKDKKRNPECPQLFQSEEGRALTPSGLLQLCQRLGDKAGVSDVHPHRFRRTAATSFLRSGANLLDTKRLLGHSSLTMVERYAALATDDLQAAHDQHSPVKALQGRYRGSRR